MLGGRLEWVFYAVSRRNALPPAQPFSALPRGSQVRGDGGRQEEAGGGEKNMSTFVYVDISNTKYGVRFRQGVT